MRRLLFAVTVTLVATLAVGQLVLPSLAAQRLRSELEENGSQAHVDVAAFPAIKLLWRRADRVTVTIARYRAVTAGGEGPSLADMLARTRGTDDLDVHVGVLEDQLLRIRDVRLHKDGDALVADVSLLRRDLDAALPARLRLTERSVPGGFEVAGETSLFGQQLAARARVTVDGRGRLVLRPEGFPLASLVSVPIFSDERVAVETIGARTLGDGVAVTVRGHLRG